MSALFYSSVFIVTSLLAEFSTNLRKKDIIEKTLNFLVVLFVVAIPSFVSGIRYGIGTDYFAYEKIFLEINSGIPIRVEPGYQLLNLVVGKLGGSINVVFFIVTFLMMLFVYLFLYTYKDSFSLGLGYFTFFLLIYNISFNIVRMGLAISIVLYSLKYIEQKKFWSFLLIALLATSIHYSAMVIIPFYLLYNKLGEKSWQFKFLVYSLTFIGLYYHQTILLFVVNNILGNDYYLIYAQSSEEVSIGLGVFASYLPPLIPGFLFYNHLAKKNKNFKLYFFILLIGFLVSFLSYMGSPILGRISNYFLVSIVWLVPFYYKQFKNTQYHGIGVLLVLTQIIIWYITIVYLGTNNTIPYVTIF